MAKNQEKVNIVCNAMGEGIWFFGTGLASALTVLPLLIQKLGGSKIEAGLVPAIWLALQMAPQVISSIFIQRGVGRKWFLLIYHWIVFTIPWLVMAAAIYWLSGSHPAATRVSILVLFTIFVGCMGFIMPVWQDWVASLFHVQSRGKAFALSNFTIALFGLLSAWAASEATSRISYPMNYAFLFIGSGICVALCMFMWVPTHTVEKVEHRPELPPREVFKRFSHSLSDKNFRNLLISRTLLIIGAGPLNLLALYYKTQEAGGLTETTIIKLGIAAAVGSSIGGWLMGHLGDRIGHRSGAIIGACAQLIGICVALFIPGLLSGIIAFAVIGVGAAGNPNCASNWISHANLLFETCPHDCRAAHIAVGNMVLAPLSLLVPVLTGLAIDQWGYALTMQVCLLPTILGILWIIKLVREPRDLNGSANPQSAKPAS